MLPPEVVVELLPGQGLQLHRPPSDPAVLAGPAVLADLVAIAGPAALAALADPPVLAVLAGLAAPSALSALADPAAIAALAAPAAHGAPVPPEDSRMS